jgi:putative membrane protein
MLDLVLAIAHHLLVFGLAGILAAELGLVSVRMGAIEVRRLAAIDVGYGALATLIVAVGVLRVLFAAKGWAYYAANLFFWAKMGGFAAIGLLSIGPTLRFVRWRRAWTREQALPPTAEIGAVQRLLWLEAALFAGVIACAAAMARGYGAG